jgi:arginine/lysine/ornithine decarboxylase
MPSHKGAKDFNKIFPLATFDITEIEDGGLYSSIENAKADLKEILGAGAVEILSTGASVGVLSAVYSVKDLGDSLIINRSAHKSVYNALKLSNLEPIVCANGFENGLPKLPTAKETAKALDQNPNAVGVLYTYPDYFGRTFDIKAIKKEVEKRGKLLIIDGAHGGHYAFLEGLVYAGEYADIWIDSLHKTASTLNQGALILAKDEKYQDRISGAVEIFNTTSPNYPIIASCEYGVKELNENKLALSKFNSLVNEIKLKLTNLGVSLVENNDPYKITVDLLKSGININELLTGLNEKNIYYELFDGERFILFMPSIKTKKGELKTLYKVFAKCSVLGKSEFAEEKISVPKKRAGYLESLCAETEEVEIEKSTGRICAENAGVFPPCYPIIICGEEINKSVVKKLIKAESENKAFGVKNGKIKVKVKAEK